PVDAIKLSHLVLLLTRFSHRLGARIVTGHGVILGGRTRRSARVSHQASQGSCTSGPYDLHSFCNPRRPALRMSPAQCSSPRGDSTRPVGSDSCYSLSPHIIMLLAPAQRCERS